MILELKKRKRLPARPYCRNPVGYNGVEIVRANPGGMTHRDKIEVMLYNYLLEARASGKTTLAESFERVFHTKPEKILDVAIRLLPKQVETGPTKILAPIIIQMPTEDEKIAPVDSNVIDGAIVG